MKTNKIGGLIPSLLVLPLFLFTLSACESGSDGECSGIVCGVALDAYLDGTDLYAQASATLNGGSLEFPALSFPIRHPDNGEQVGFVQVALDLSGNSVMSIAYNLSSISRYPAEFDGRLPNGSPIPIVGLDTANMISVQIQKNIRIYAGVENRLGILGVAIPISQMDGTGSQVCPVALMPTFRFSNGVRGSAGVFMGCEPGTSGISVFADISSVLQANQDLAAIAGLNSIELNSLQSHRVEVRGVSAANSREERKANRALRKFYRDNRNTKLSLVND